MKICFNFYVFQLVNLRKIRNRLLPSIKQLSSFLILLLLLFCTQALAQSSSPSLPSCTELISQKKQDTKQAAVTMYEYSSCLSKEEIIKFYKESFLSLQMNEIKNSLQHGIFIFERYPFQSKELNFKSAQENGKTFYSLTEYFYRNLSIVPSTTFTTPQKLDFMPTFPDAWQFIYSTYWSPMIGVWYLSGSEPEQVCDFYLKNMPSFGWQLADSVSKQGSYNFYQWFQFVDPFSKALPTLQARNYEEFITPLAIRGKTLTFRQGEKNCTIAIYKFDDIVEKAKGTIWDASAFEQYGSTMISVFYFPEKAR